MERGDTLALLNTYQGGDWLISFYMGWLVSSQGLDSLPRPKGKPYSISGNSKGVRPMMGWVQNEIIDSVVCLGSTKGAICIHTPVLYPALIQHAQLFSSLRERPSLSGDSELAHSSEKGPWDQHPPKHTSLNAFGAVFWVATSYGLDSKLGLWGRVELAYILTTYRVFVLCEVGWDTAVAPLWNSNTHF